MSSTNQANDMDVSASTMIENEQSKMSEAVKRDVNEPPSIATEMQ
jgi:hypothetical protein